MRGDSVRSAAISPSQSGRFRVSMVGGPRADDAATALGRDGPAPPLQLDRRRVHMSEKTRPCEICRKPIEPGRVEVLPDTRLCAEHARRIDRHGGELHPHDGAGADLQGRQPETELRERSNPQNAQPQGAGEAAGRVSRRGDREEGLRAFGKNEGRTTRSPASPQRQARASRLALAWRCGLAALSSLRPNLLNLRQGDLQRLPFDLHRRAVRAAVRRFRPPHRQRLARRCTSRCVSMAFFSSAPSVPR